MCKFGKLHVCYVCVRKRIRWTGLQYFTIIIIIVIIIIIIVIIIEDY